MLRGVLTVGAWTMASRVLGFARDMLIAAMLGAGPVADAFFVANRMPNLFRRLFGEGAFNAAFVPAFSGLLAAAAAAPLIYNLTSIGFMLGLAGLVPTVGHALAWGVSVSGIFQLALLLVA